MRDWAVCTIGTTAPLEIDRFEKSCAFEPYGSECRLIPTIRRDLAAAKTAAPGGWPHLRIGNLLSEHFPGTFCIVANDTPQLAPDPARICLPRPARHHPCDEASNNSP